MSKFNKAATDTTKTVNAEGGLAFTLDDKAALYMSASTSLGGGAGDKFYTSANNEYKNILSLVAKVSKNDPAFIFQLAAYARQKLYLRSIPMILFIEGIRAMHANKKAGAQYPVDVTRYATEVFGRPDEITEAIAYWLYVNEGNHKLPMPLRNSLEIAFNKFNEYLLNKYDSDNKTIKMRDVLRLVHPTPKDETQAALFNYLIRGTGDITDGLGRNPLTQEQLERLLPQTAAKEKLMKLTAFDDEAKALITASNATWEVVVSKFGSTPEVWSYVINNMGYMATLRNLNNFIKHNIDLTPILTKLTDEKEVKNSKQLPFRYLSALKAVGGVDLDYKGYSKNILNSWTAANAEPQDNNDKIKSALGQALNLSVANIPRFAGRTLCSADVSGSMESPLNAKSQVTMKDIACVMTAMAGHISEEGIVSAFGTTFEVQKPEANILDTAMNLSNSVSRVGMATNAYLILEYLIKNNIVCDRVMYFTDTVCYGGYGGKQSLNALWKRYRTLMAANHGKQVYLYEVNLAGGNTSNFDRSSGVAQLAGWSDKIFEMMSMFESDPRSAVTKIQELYPA